MRISVLIPTYNRPKTLLQALYSVQKQTLSDIEILVVDNAADPEVDRIITEFNLGARVRVSCVRELRLGLHHARHAGVRRANSQLLVFTDDDATFDPGWLKAYSEAFAEHPEMVAAGGPVRPIWEIPPPRWLLQFIGDANTFGILSIMEPYKEFRLDSKKFFFGVNMAIRRDVLFEVGGFNPESFGDIWLGDGESGLNRKLCDRGMLIGYVPQAVVYHHIPPQRMTVDYFYRRIANEGACDMYARFHQGIPCRFRLIKHAAFIIAKHTKIWAESLLLRGNTDVRSLQIQLHAARTLSYLKYTLRLILDKDFHELVLKKNWLND